MTNSDKHPVDQILDIVRSGKLTDFINEFSLNAVRHKTYSNLVLLKYNQIESPKGTLADYCRGLIIDTDAIRVVSYGYKRFFNYGEGYAAEIDWASSKATEKLDGSICVLYYYKGWRVATSGSPDASGNVNTSNFTFKDLFWKTWNDLGYKLPESTDSTNFCFMFELCAPENRIVIPYEKPRLVLHGVRNLFTYEETDPSNSANAYGWELIKTYDFQTLEAVLASAEKLGAIEQEGYVCRDKYFNRIKIKGPAYVALHQSKDGICPRRIVELIQTGEDSEFLSYFPDLKKDFDKYHTSYNQLVTEAKEYYNSIKDIELQKEFAFKALTKPYSGGLFMVRNGKVPSLEAWFANHASDKVLEMLDNE